MEKAKLVIDEMMNDRNYRLKNPDEIIYENDKEHQIKIILCIGSKVNIDVMKKYIYELDGLKIYHAIIVYDKTITSSAKKIIEQIVKFYFEVFFIDELQYNITKHILYSKHEKITFKNNITKKLPVIFKTDPVCRYFNFQKGDIIKITRKNDMIIYRIVK